MGEVSMLDAQAKSGSVNRLTAGLGKHKSYFASALVGCLVSFIVGTDGDTLEGLIRTTLLDDKVVGIFGCVDGLAGKNNLTILIDLRLDAILRGNILGHLQGEEGRLALVTTGRNAAIILEVYETTTISEDHFIEEALNIEIRGTFDEINVNGVVDLSIAGIRVGTGSISHSAS